MKSLYLGIAGLMLVGGLAFVFAGTSTGPLASTTDCGCPSCCLQNGCCSDGSCCCETGVCKCDGCDCACCASGKFQAGKSCQSGGACCSTDKVPSSEDKSCEGKSCEGKSCESGGACCKSDS